MKNIIYCRKSSEASDRQVLSIESQEKEILALAERHQSKVSKIFRESMSAKQPGRPEFEKMIKLIEQNPGSIIFVWKLDRLARNPVDEGKIKWLLQKNVIAKIITPERIYLPNDNALISAVEFGMANQYIRDLSTNVKRGNKTKLEKGELPGPAPIGYLDNLATKKKEIDPVKAPLIKLAFELYATGGYSLKEVNNLVYDKGLRTKGGLRISKSQFDHILRNPFYSGVIKRNDQLYPGQHQPIVSKQLFDDVQNVLSGKSRPRPKTHFFPVRGFMFCHSCGCLLTASIKKGHTYYYCTNGKGKCEQHKKYINKDKADELIAGLFEKLKFKPEEVEIAYAALKEKIQMKGYSSVSKKDQLAQNLKIEQGKLSNLSDIISTDPSMKESLKPKILSLEASIKNIEGQILQLTTQTQEQALTTLEQTKKAFLQACSASFDYLEGNDIKKSNVLKKLLWNAKIENQIVQQYQFKLPFSLMAESPKNLVLSEWLPG
jgi:site-specific DNA recombinase